MSGKQHMAIGTTMSIILCILGVYLKILEVNSCIIFIVAGAVIGSYMPDICAKNSKASQAFNKIVLFAVLLFGIVYFLQDSISIDAGKKMFAYFNYTKLNKIGWIMFMIVTVLGKLSPHRVFTHKWFGTSIFLTSVYLIGNKYFFIGFTIGYILHMIADRFFTKNGQYLNFFEFKLPLTNSKGNISINW